MKRFTKIFSTIALVLLTTSNIIAQNANKTLAKVSEDYKKRNLVERNVPEIWEDGIRTTGEKGTYEWWYFDAHLHDGSTAVIVFYTKNNTQINKPLTPFVSLIIDKADGSNITKDIYCKPEEFYASKDSCNVKIGKNYVVGNLKEYEIHIEDEDINFTAKIKRTTESWRPKTGHIVFGPEESKEFNWVVPVPQGKMEVEYDYKGTKTKTDGSAYHDHNWGNISMLEVFNHWY